MVYKGKVSAVLNGGKAVSVTPYTGSTVTAPMIVPFFLIGALPVGTPIAYMAFDDSTGVVLSRMDGDWNHQLPSGEGADIKALVENDVCTVFCGGTSELDVDVVIEDGVCKVSC